MCPGAQLGRDRGPRPHGPPICSCAGPAPCTVSRPVLKGGAAVARPWDGAPVCSSAGVAPCMCEPAMGTRPGGAVLPGSRF